MVLECQNEVIILIIWVIHMTLFYLVYRKEVIIASDADSGET